MAQAVHSAGATDDARMSHLSHTPLTLPPGAEPGLHPRQSITCAAGSTSHSTPPYAPHSSPLPHHIPSSRSHPPTHTRHTPTQTHPHTHHTHTRTSHTHTPTHPSHCCTQVKVVVPPTLDDLTNTQADPPALQLHDLPEAPLGAVPFQPGTAYVYVLTK